MRGARRVLAERTLNARRLGRIVELGRGAVGIDVETLGRPDVALGHRQRYRAGNAGSLGIRARDVIGIIGVAVAHDLGINVRTARLCMLHALEYEHAGTLAHHKAVAVCIERATSRRGIGVGGQCAAGRKARNGIGDNCSLGAAREDRVGIAVLDGAERLADRMGRGCARGHHGQGRALCLVADCDIARCHVGDHHRDHIGRCAAGPTFGNRMDVVDERRHAAHARAHVDAQALAIDGAFDIKARIVHGFVRSRHRKLNAGVQMLGVTLAKVLVAVKALDLGCHLDGKRIGIEVRDRADAARAGAHGRPGGKRGVAERRYGTDAGDCNSLFHHGLLIQAAYPACFLHRHSAVDAYDFARNVSGRIAR